MPLRLKRNANQAPRCPSSVRPVSLRFLDFPYDIRYLIYHHLLVDNSFDPEPTVGLRHWRRHLFPKILRTCRQIHDEAVHILYGRNYFILEMTYDNCWDSQLYYIDHHRWTLECVRHAPLMRNWRILIKNSEYTSPGRTCREETIPWKLRIMLMIFQRCKISLSNLFVSVGGGSLPLINVANFDLLSPLKELRVGGKISIQARLQYLAPRGPVFEYFQNVKAIIKASPKREGLKVIFQEDARVARSRFFIQDLEAVAKTFQDNIDDERHLTELRDILRMLGRDRAKGILQSPKRLVRKELFQYLGLLEDIFNSILLRRMKTRSSFEYSGSDGDLFAMGRARRWLYMRPEYLAWIQRHDRNGWYSRGPIFYEEEYWTDSWWHNKNKNDDPSPSSPPWDGQARPAEVDPSESLPSSNITRPFRTARLYRPRNPNERYAITLEDLYSAEDMPVGLRHQASTCTLKFGVSRRQQRQAVWPKRQRPKKPRKRTWVDGGEGGGKRKLSDCLEFYEECFF